MSDEIHRPVKSGNYFTAAAILILALVLSKVNCAASPLTIGLSERFTELARVVVQKDTASPPPTTITEGIQHPIRLISAEMDIWILQAGRRDYIRSFLPDGFVSAWLSSRCATHASIDVSGLSRDDVSLTHSEDGSSILLVILPDPVISFIGSELEEWGFSSKWVLNPSRAALELRSALRDALPGEAISRAAEAGLQEEARALARDCLASVLHCLGVDNVEIQFRRETEGNTFTFAARRLEEL
jgi:hypothetical protein